MNHNIIMSSTIKNTNEIKTKRQKQFVIICLNPNCQESSQRCLDSRSIRTHPSDCSKHYFQADIIESTSWNHIPDYPSDPLGISVYRKIRQQGKDKQYQSVFDRMIGNLKQKLLKVVELFSKKFQEYLPSSCLQDYYLQTYSLDSIAKSLKQGDSAEYISKCINVNFYKNRYGQLEQINRKLDSISYALENILTGFKGQLKSLLQETTPLQKSSSYSTKELEESKNKPRIQYGLIKSKFIASSKIQCSSGQISFPKIQGIVSFLPWVYSDRGFNSGIHQLRITSLKFPSHPNAGLTVLEEHDIDTYPYHYFKSLFSKEGRGFQLVSATQLDLFEKYINQNSKKSNEKKQRTQPLSEIQFTIGQISQIILRLQLNSNPRAILRDIEGTCIYVCQLSEGKKYRLGIYGSGWVIKVNQLY